MCELGAEGCRGASVHRDVNLVADLCVPCSPTHLANLDGTATICHQYESLYHNIVKYTMISL